MTNKKYLGIITVSPVQSYIEQAEEVKDLYKGSKIISNIIQNIINKLKDKINVIYPNTEKIENITVNNIPNKIVFTIENGKFDKSTFKNIENNYLNEVINSNELVKEELKEILKLTYILVPYENEENYKEIYSKAVYYLDGIKKYTPIKQIEKNNELYNKKGTRSSNNCVICGERIATKLKSEGKYQLCEICNIKREYEVHDELNNISLSDYALYSNFEKKDIQDFKDSLKDKNKNNSNKFDIQCVFPETIDNLPKESKEQTFQKKCRNEFLDHMRKKGYEVKEDSELCRYYAMIMFDGDNMGKIISGNSSILKDEYRKGVNLKEFQKKLSKAQSEFGANVSTGILPYGNAVYSGGDDFLGFVGLKYLKEAIEQIEENHYTGINEKLSNYLNKNEKITKSYSIVIAHHKTPLKKVLRIGRESLALCKNREDSKDGMCITYITGSGNLNRVFLKNKNYKDIFKLIYHLNNGLSSKFITNLEVEFPKFFDMGNTSLTDVEYPKISQMTNYELKRLIGRSLSNLNNSDDKELIKMEIYTLLNNYIDKNSNNRKISIENLANLVYIADKLKKYYKEDDTNNNNNENQRGE